MQGNFLIRKFPHTPSKNFMGQGLRTSGTAISKIKFRAPFVGPFPLRFRLPHKAAADGLQSQETQTLLRKLKFYASQVWRQS